MKIITAFAIMVLVPAVATQAEATPISNYVTTGEAFNGGTQDTTGNPAIYGQNTASSGYGAGVYGASTSGDGVYGTTAGITAAGVHGHTATAYGWGVHGDASGAATAVYGDNPSTTGWSGYFNGRLYVQTCISVNGDVIGGSCSSDERLKKNIKPLVGSLAKLVALRPVTFEWRDPEPHAGNTSGTKMGFLAQDVEQVMPGWVGADERGYKTVNRDDLPVMLVEAVLELKNDNDELRSRLVATTVRSASVFALGGLVGLAAALGFLVVRRKPS